MSGPCNETTSPASFWEFAFAVCVAPIVCLGMAAALLWAAFVIGFSIRYDVRDWLAGIPKRSR